MKHIDEARKWLGTPFHINANKINVGVDCAHFIVESLKPLNINFNIEEHCHYLLSETEQPALFLRGPFEKAISEYFEYYDSTKFKKGDIIVFNINGQNKHVSIATSDNTHIHVDVKRGVIDDVLEPAFLKRISHIYRYIK